MTKKNDDQTPNEPQGDPQDTPSSEPATPRTPESRNTEQWHRAIEKARTEERTKLRDQISASDARAAAAESKIEALEARLSSMETSKPDNKKDSSFDKDAFRSELMSSVKGVLEESQAQIKSLRAELDRERRLAAEAKNSPDEFIPELVTATDPAVFEQQLAESREVMARIRNPLQAQIQALQAELATLKNGAATPNSQNTPAGNQPPTQSPTNVNSPPPVSPGEGPSDILPDDPATLRAMVRNMSHEDWAKRRNELKAAVRPARGSNPFVR